MVLWVSYFVLPCVWKKLPVAGSAGPKVKKGKEKNDKKIIGLCVGAVVLAAAVAGVKEGCWIMKHRWMQHEFTHELSAFTMKTNKGLIQPTIYAENILRISP